MKRACSLLPTTPRGKSSALANQANCVTKRAPAAMRSVANAERACRLRSNGDEGNLGMHPRPAGKLVHAWREICVAALALAATLAPPQPASADPVADFYRG